MTAEEIRELVAISEAGGRGLDELVRENPHLAGRISRARLPRERPIGGLALLVWLITGLNERSRLAQNVCLVGKENVIIRHF
jgi:hypothetical protein